MQVRGEQYIIVLFEDMKNNRLKKTICEFEALPKILQFFKYAVVGASNVVVSYTVNVSILKIMEGLHISLDYVIANIGGYVVSVLWAFYWNNKYVFVAKEGKKWWKILLKTYAVYAFSDVVLSNVLSYVWIHIFGISKYFAPLCNTVITLPVNFMLNKFWAFDEDIG